MAKLTSKQDLPVQGKFYHIELRENELRGVIAALRVIAFDLRQCGLNTTPIDELVRDLEGIRGNE